MALTVAISPPGSGTVSTRQVSVSGELGTWGSNSFSGTAYGWTATPSQNYRFVKATWTTVEKIYKLDNGVWTLQRTERIARENNNADYNAVYDRINNPVEGWDIGSGYYADFKSEVLIEDFTAYFATATNLIIRTSAGLSLVRGGSSNNILRDA